MRNLLIYTLSVVVGLLSMGGREINISEKNDVVSFTENIIGILQGKRSLTEEQVRFLCPETMQDTRSFFIELNRSSALIKHLAEAVESSALDADSKKLFRERISAESKDMAWNEILLNRLALPRLLPASASNLSKISEPDFLRISGRIEKFVEAYHQELVSGKNLEKLFSLQRKYYPLLIEIIEKEVVVSNDRRMDLYFDFFEKVFVRGHKIQALERSMPKEIRDELIRTARPFFRELRKIDSPLKDYIYLRFYEKIREETL